MQARPAYDSTICKPECLQSCPPPSYPVPGIKPSVVWPYFPYLARIRFQFITVMHLHGSGYRPKPALKSGQVSISRHPTHNNILDIICPCFKNILSLQVNNFHSKY